MTWVRRRGTGSGMFGSVYESKDGQNVIKEGKLSPKEMAILAKLKDVKAFPNLIDNESPHPLKLTMRSLDLKLVRMRRWVTSKLLQPVTI